MTISYPLSPPTNISQARISLSKMDVVSQSSSPFTLESQIQAHDGEVWILEITLPSVTRAEAAPWIGFLAALRGKYGTFLFGDVNATQPLGVATGTPLVMGGGQTGRTLVTDGWSPNITGILKAGDYIQLGQRLHVVLQDADSNGSGQATLDIWPSLRSSPADNEAIITENTKGLFKLPDTTTPLYSVGANKAYLVSFSAVEPLS